MLKKILINILTSILSILFFIIKKVILFLEPKQKLTSLENIQQISLNKKEVKLSVRSALQLVEYNIENLVSPLGEFHWRGLNHPDKAYLNNKNEFHANEQGDSALHTGVLLMGLCWKYYQTENPMCLVIIKKLIDYFELHQGFNNGGLARSFVKEKFYEKFPDSERNSEKGNMRYRRVLIDKEYYWQRYDISIDAISHVIAGVYWAYKYTPFKKQCLQILTNQLNYYEKSNWRIRDDLGKIVRYGNHDPDTNLFSKINKIILNRIIHGKDYFNIIDNALYNSFPSIIGNSSINYFNSFIDITQILIMSDLGYDVNPRLNILYEEIKQDDNYFFNSVYNYIKKQNILKTTQNLKEWVINIGHGYGLLKAKDNVPLNIKRGYFRWEFSPKVCYDKFAEGNEVTGNSDLLLAYYLHPKK